jgi:Domain of unknown function (DUF4328)
MRNIVGKAAILRVTLILWAVISLICALIDIVFISGLALPTLLPDMPWVDVSAIVNLLGLIVAAIAWSVWIYAASKNLWDIYPDGVTFSPASCIWWNIVPIASLFKPYQAMREIQGLSLNESIEFAAEDNDTIKFWWGFWIASLILANVAVRLPSPGSVFVDIFASLAKIAAIWFTLKLVKEITHAQQSGVSGLASVFA